MKKTTRKINTNNIKISVVFIINYSFKSIGKRNILNPSRIICILVFIIS